MRDCVATLMSDFYKQTHAEQYNKDVSLIVSYLTPRMSRLAGEDKLIMFGAQGFVQEFLIEYFNKNFFELPESEAVDKHKRVIESCMGKGTADFEKIRALHKLGYLPVEIKIIPEGTRVPIHVPMVEIRNTHPDFAWITNFIESVMSCELWYPMTVANQAYRYRQIVNKAYSDTVDNWENLAKHAISEFGFRGAKGREAGTLAGAAFLTSFDKTATIPSLLYLEDYYKCNIEEGNVGGGMISTEHSVMCSNTAIDGDEKTFIKKLLTDIYPNGNISVVCDSYDYWNVVQNIICSELKKDVMNRNGCLYVRGDSGDPIDIICGDYNFYNINSLESIGKIMDIVDRSTKPTKFRLMNNEGKPFRYYEGQGKRVNNRYAYVISEYTPHPSELGTVECLYNAFGGTVNSKGYIELDKHIRAIYGDSITPDRAYRIYYCLKHKGFAANNVALGAGSFSMQCTENEGKLKPFTRDTYGIAVKATYCELKDGTPIPIFKDPKTDTGKFKKSQKGMCCVYTDEAGEITYKDGYTSETIKAEDDKNMFITIFKDGKTYNLDSIHEIRNRIHDGRF